MKLKAIFTLVLVVSSISLALKAQPTIQDCLGAIPVCQDVFVEANSPVGTGTVNNEIPPGTCTDGEQNSIWYVFTASENGSLGFLITPNSLDDDYDWALFDVTNVSCGNLQQNDLVSCNAAGGPPCNGVTGCSASGTGNNTGGGCSGTGPINQLVPVIQGNTYMLMVSNWTGSPNGYRLDFSESTGLGIFDQAAPLVSDINMLPESCGDQKINMITNEFLSCATVQNNDFELLGPGGPYTISVSSPNCQEGSRYSNFFNLFINPPIQALGDFTLNISAAADDHLLDLCRNQMEDVSFSFSVDMLLDLEVDIGSDTSLLCAGDDLILNASTSAQDLVFLWEDGFDGPIRTVNNEGVYSVTVTNECGIGEDEVEVYVQVQPPSVDLGMDQQLCEGDEITLDADNGVAFYTWQDNSSKDTLLVNSTGDYAVTVVNGCGEDQDSINLIFIPLLNLGLASEYVLCQGDTLIIDVERPFATYQWSDGSNLAYREITEDGQFALTVTTLCETYEADFNSIFLVDPKFDLGENLELCPNDIVKLTGGIPGASYLWQDGSTLDTFHVTLPNTYRVTITTACNVLTDSVVIDYLLSVTTDLGRDTFLCPEDPFLLDASTEVAASYRWDNDDKEKKRLIFGPGDYSVTVTSICETLVDTIYIDECEICNVYLPNIFSPNNDGANDRFFAQSPCVIADYQMHIFDRWGNQIFTTNNADQHHGWDGKIKGEIAQQATYIWFVEYTVTENGYERKMKKQGTIVLLR